VLITIPDHAAVATSSSTSATLGKEGGSDEVFEPVIDDILAKLGGEPLDLYLMTHEHLDHVQGLFSRAEPQQVAQGQAGWLTGSAHRTTTTHLRPEAKDRGADGLPGPAPAGCRRGQVAVRGCPAGQQRHVDDKKCVDYVRTS
jgi:glyoxylase-like metal-dependent hydrolase (beta-lactamase superfamily II)